MLPYPQTARPRENGQPTAAHPAYLGEHITSVVSSKWQPPMNGKLATSQQQIVTYRDNHARITTAPQPSVTPQIVTHLDSATSIPTSLPRPTVINVITLPPYHSARSHQHSALSPAPRNIKATSGWLWQEHDALAVIAAKYGVGERGRAARSVYVALTQVASQQRTPDRAHTSCQYLGQLALLSERATRRYLHDFVEDGLIDVIPGIHQANTFVLLAVGTDDRLADGTMPLADGAGDSQSMPANVGSYSVRAASSDSPDQRVTKSRAATADSPMRQPASTNSTSRAASSGSQIRRIKDSKNQEQQTNNGAGAAGSLAGDSRVENTGTPADNPMLLIAAREKPTLTAEQAAAANSLTDIGVRRNTAEEIAATHTPDDVRGWVRYAIRAGGLKSRAGFVLTMLRAGEAPPTDAEQYHIPSFNPPTLHGDEYQNSSTDTCAAPDGTAGLTATLPGADDAPALGGEVPTTEIADCSSSSETAPARHSTLSTQHSALWLAAREELARRITGPAWGLWLKHVRLVAVERDTWRLSRPSCGVTGSFERRHAAEIEEVLADLNGQDARLEWVEAGRELVD